MKLQLNGEAVESSARTLRDLLVAEGYETSVVATAVNGTFVPRAARAGCRLNDGDAIEIVAPMQGG